METLMVVLFLLTAILCVAGACYFAIIAPSLRRRLQFEVYELRDKGRAAYASLEIDLHAYEFIEDRCNLAIGIVDVIDLRILFRVLRQMKSLPAEEREQMLKEYESLAHLPVVRNTAFDLAFITRKAIFVNSGYWGLIFWTVFALSRIISQIRSWKVVQRYSESTRELVINLPVSAIEQLRVYPNRLVHYQKAYHGHNKNRLANSV